MKVKRDYSTKPYNRCLSCPNLGVHCDGARASAMPLERWCEFMRDIKEVKGLTNVYISETSGVSLKTIERLMAQNCEQDIMRETARRIEDAIIGSSNTYPCILAFEESRPKESEALRDLERATADNARYLAMLESVHKEYNADKQTIREEAQRKIDHLLSEIEFLKVENERKARIIDKFLDK